MYRPIGLRLAVISPTKYLKEFSCYRDNSYHLVLAQRFLNDSLYADFYRKERRRPNSTIILDNGACELKKSIDYKLLFSVYKELVPDFLILPDCLNDGALTVQMSTEFIDRYFANDTKGKVELVGVPQGTTEGEWIKSFDYFYNHNRVSMLGLSNVKALNINNRFEAIEYLLSKGYSFKDKKVHILGMGDSGHEEINRLRGYSFVEGIDTSAPVVHGYHGVQFEVGKGYKKVDTYLRDDLRSINSRQKKLINNNLKLLYDIVK